MPHVIVHFDPTRIDQSVIDELKPALQRFVSQGMTYPATECEDRQEILVELNEIYVRQQEAHPTDVNPAIVEVEIQAGKAHGRDASKVVEDISELISESGIIPKEILATPDVCIWLRFCDDNAFELLG
ncbi:MAG TPA: hypothetical protein PK609_02460 [Candidatus Paceibacterota bacterium]|nr:hypothetical protein [Candidatus Paceibacterota bacterium]